MSRRMTQEEYELGKELSSQISVDGSPLSEISHDRLVAFTGLLLGEREVELQDRRLSRFLLIALNSIRFFVYGLAFAGGSAIAEMLLNQTP